MFATDFETQEREFRNRKTAISSTVTIVVHALLLLLLLFTILHKPDPPLEDNAGGMSVNYGTDETGAGNIQPFTYNPGPTPTAAATPPPAAVQPEAATEPDVLTQDAPSDVVVNKPDDKPKPKIEKKAILKPQPKPVTATKPTVAEKVTPSPTPTPEPEKPKVNSRALFAKGAQGKPNNSKGDGTGGAQGDQGKSDGDVNSHNYMGDGGNGNGPGTGPGNKGGFSLKGRSKLGLPAPNNCGSGGRVVIAIKVDKTGKVVEATFRRFDSTVYDDCNVSNALNAARKATFNADANAPDIQVGTITYIYKVN